MLIYKVSDMSCGHCVRTVTDAVQRVDPRAGVQIDLTSGEVRVESAGATFSELIAESIKAAGYDAELIRPAA